MKAAEGANYASMSDWFFQMVFIASALVWLAIRHTVGIRLETEDELAGLDQVELGLEAYPEFGKGSQTLSQSY